MSYAEEELAARLGNESFEAALFYSRMATETFARLTDRSAIFPLFDRSGLICISERAARPLYRWGGGRVRAAATPDEKAMLALLAG
jgi:uroporphyrinogen-III synthase